MPFLHTTPACLCTLLDSLDCLFFLESLTCVAAVFSQSSEHTHSLNLRFPEAMRAKRKKNCKILVPTPTAHLLLPVFAGCPSRTRTVYSSLLLRIDTLAPLFRLTDRST